MRRTIFLSACIVAWIGGAVVWGEVSVIPLQGDSAAAGGIPTMGDLQADFEDGRYTVCEQKIGRILGAQTPPSSADEYLLFSLKGECLLQQKQGLTAAQAFQDAALAAPEKGDAAVGFATYTLIKRSANYAYTPLTGMDRTPLPIQKKSKRGPALAAMLADEMAKFRGTYEAALVQTEAANVLDFVPALASLTKLELGATGATAQTSAMEKALAAHLRELVEKTIKGMNTDADAMCVEASRMIDVQPVDNRPTYRRRKGLTEEDKTKLKDMLASCDKVVTVIRQAGTGFPGVGAKGFKVEMADEDALQNRLHGILVGNFRPPPKVVSPLTK